jgi:hypothetical protein
LKLSVDGTLNVESSEAIVPSVLGQELFIGSGYEAVDQLDGAVGGVTIAVARAQGP